MCLPGPGWINSVLLSLILTLPQTDQGQHITQKYFVSSILGCCLRNLFITQFWDSFIEYGSNAIRNLITDYQKLGNRRLILLSQILD